MHEIPKIDKPLMADMTSVILSQPLDVSKFDLIYAGAQKYRTCWLNDSNNF